MPESGSDLDLRYQKVLLSFEELNKLPPNPLLLGIGELPNKVFLDSVVTRYLSRERCI